MTVEPKKGEDFVTLNKGKRGEKKVKVYKRKPKGWKEDKRATTAPRGYKWINNNKSRFSGKRKQALIKEE